MHSNRQSSAISINVNHEKNGNMNKSAILVNKWEIDLAQQLPRFVHSIRSNSKFKTININKGLINQGIKNKTIHHIVCTSIKRALKFHQGKNSNNRQQSRDETQHLEQDNRKVFQKFRNRKAKIKNKLQRDREFLPGEKYFEQELSSVCYPPNILNILYKQNIKNYNPFVSALEQLQVTTCGEQLKNQIRKLCYIGIARCYLQNKKHFQLPSYSRVGLQIRTYMIDVMAGNLEKKAANEYQTTFIKINQTGLSFNPYNRPKQLEDTVSKKRFYQIINNTNKIIEKQYSIYKRSSFQIFNNVATYSQIGLYILLALIIICIIIWSPEDQQSNIGYAAFFGILIFIIVGMLFSWIQCRNTIEKICPPNNLTQLIERKIKQYFNTINDDQVLWKVGVDFYWIEIQNVKVKKKKVEDDPDNF